jgi:hypothetical protein
VSVNWAAGLMRWMPYVAVSGKAYPLNHLHPFRFTLILITPPGSDGLPVDLEIGFSMHTFSRGRRADDSSEEVYSDPRECRIFDEERYVLSHRLPDIVRNLSSGKCYHARNQNYLSVVCISESNGACEYRIFFVLQRSKRAPASPRTCVRLIVQSAYPAPPTARGKESPIRFPVLLRRVLGFSTSLKKRRPRTNAGPRSPNLLDIPHQVRTPKGG